MQTGSRNEQADRLDGQVARVAYLGPPGTYGHQAANAFLPHIPAQTPLIPCSTIPSIFTTPAEYLVMPLQNAIHGPVIETLDCLLDTNAEAGPSSPRREAKMEEPVIIGDLDLPIRHCLVARRGVTIEEIKWVRSHEQALGQSSKFLSERLPSADIEKWPSTAGAALSLLDESTYPERGRAGGAICSKTMVELHPDELEVLYEGTQSITNNYTRFLLLTRVRPLPTLDPPESSTSTFCVFDDLADLVRLGDGTRIKAIHARPNALHGLTSTKQSNGNEANELYPLRYLVEMSSSHTTWTGRTIGQTTLHVDMQ